MARHLEIKISVYKSGRGFWEILPYPFGDDITPTEDNIDADDSITLEEYEVAAKHVEGALRRIKSRYFKLIEEDEKRVKEEIKILTEDKK